MIVNADGHTMMEYGFEDDATVASPRPRRVEALVRADADWRLTRLTPASHSSVTEMTLADCLDGIRSRLQGFI
jgi:hypothetical protein